MKKEATCREHRDRYSELWNRVFAHLRSAGYGTSPHDAEDLAQDVFLQLLRNGGLDRMERKAKDENHLQAMVLKASKYALLNAVRRAKTAKRDTGGAMLPVDDATCDRELELASSTYDPAQEAQWHETATAAVDSERQLEREYENRGKASVFHAIKGSLIGRSEPGESRELASRFGMAEGQFRVAVCRARRRFQDLFREAHGAAA